MLRRIRRAKFRSEINEQLDAEEEAGSRPEEPRTGPDER
jgi:hypothetical protein